MNNQTEQVIIELEKLEKSVDRIISDNKVLSLELSNRDKQINTLQSEIRSSVDDVAKIKQRIAKLLLDKK